MTSIHPNEIEIQTYALGDTCGFNTIEHIKSCKECVARAANYRMLFEELSQQQPPVITFNLNQVVMSKLPQPDPKPIIRNISLLVIAILVMLALVGVFFAAMPGISSVIAAVAPILLYLVATVTILVTGFLCFEMYRKHIEQIDTINYYGKLQH